MTVAADGDTGPHRNVNGQCGRCWMDWPCTAAIVAPPEMIVRAPSEAAMRLMDTVQFALDAADEAGLSDSYSVAPRVVDALFTDGNFNDIIRVLGGEVAGLDKRMRVEWGSSVLFKQGGDLYE